MASGLPQRPTHTRLPVLLAHPLLSCAQVTLALQQPGEYKLHYELQPMRTGHAFQTATAEPSPLPPPSAALYVRVRPGKVEEMRLKLTEKTDGDDKTFKPVDEMFLGRIYAIDCTFYDAQGNPCTLKKAELVKTLNEQQIRTREQTMA